MGAVVAEGARPKWEETRQDKKMCANGLRKWLGGNRIRRGDNGMTRVDSGTGRVGNGKNRAGCKVPCR